MLRPGKPVCAVVVGGGSGSRFRSKCPKAFATMTSGESLLHVTLRRMALCQLVSAQIAVVPPGFEQEVLAWQDLADLRVSAVIAGGTHRSESVMNGLLKAAESFPYDTVVLIHDAARPCIEPELVSRVVEGTVRHGNATPVITVPDTLKLVSGEELSDTLDRDAIVAVQTPQGFLLGEHIHLLKLHPGPHLDDTIPWTLEGRTVYHVPGNRWNVKVTWPDDLAFVESVLRSVYA
ncbi:MAG: 2-C-methyl-D-erythritol 4-phosphate cytidylyltransferase [Planctomycetes bacterium]|nr:2-C-methyl-D-erythritol 4-phosphate cytidylyltransferase [Planctomycetota bacterium]